MPPRKKSKSPKKSPSSPSGKGNGRLIAAIVALALVVIGLVYLSHRHEMMPKGDAPPSAKLPAKREQPLPQSLPRQEKRPQLAIVMDDLGRSLDYGKALLDVNVPITFAILPGEAHATALAELAHRHGREVLIHLPMEPQGYPLTDPGNDALLIAMPAAEIQQRIDDFVRLVPHAAGGNNHMGSRFTENREGMRAVLAALKEADLFFLDSLTSPKSVAYAEARQAQVPAAIRDVFLDNVQDVEKIAGEIRRLVQVARRQGHAVGICHPYPQTLEALRQTANELRQAGIDLVPVAQLVAL
jgi:hypothetical protein